jgi:hypothetical protein
VVAAPIVSGQCPLLNIAMTSSTRTCAGETGRFRPTCEDLVRPASTDMLNPLEGAHASCVSIFGV